MAKSKLFGKSSKGKTGGGKGTAKMSAAFPATVVPTAPHLSGNADVVHERMAQVTQGSMEQKQLKKNKSLGLRPKK